jgi:hypothetical protein
VATTTCGNATTILPPYGGAPYFPNEDASASDGPNEAAADAGDSSMTTGPTDSSSAPDVPMGFSILYGAAIIPDE